MNAAQSVSASAAAGPTTVLFVVLVVLLYVWIALGLSALFRKCAEESWKGWVPIYNQIVVLQLGGISGWFYLLILIPVAGVVAVYVLLITAAHRINVAFGYGAGMTVLAAVLYPVWATVLGFGSARWVGSRYQAGSRDQRGADASGPVPMPIVGRTGSPQIAPLPDEAPGHSAPEAGAPFERSVEPVFVPPSGLGPQRGLASEGDSADFVAEPWGLPPASTRAEARAVQAWGSEAEDFGIPVGGPIASVPGQEAVEAGAEPSDILQPRRAAAEAPASLPPVTQPLLTRPLVTRAPFAAPEAAAEVPEPWAPRRSAIPSPDEGYDETTGEVSAVVGAPQAGAPRSALASVSALHTKPEVPEDDSLDETVITRRRRLPWELVPPVGAPIDILSDVVILGRRPVADPGYPKAQLIAIGDDTRTVSKTHARLELRGDSWFVTDLESTNGVVLVTLMGTEIDAEPGVELAAGERFFLGDAEVRLRRTDT